MPSTPSHGDQITTVEALDALPEGALVKTRMFVREKTYAPSEWDMVLTSAEVLAEGDGSVTVIGVDPDQT